MNILISAYSCEPSKGSESEVGWGVVLEASKRHDVWVLTRVSNRQAIESDQRSANANIRWIYYDLDPKWLYLKKFKFGIYPYYYFWQCGVMRVAKRLHLEVGFDVIQHATFCNYWMPTRLHSLGAPFVWGPVGGGEALPASFISEIGWRGCFEESLRFIARSIGERLPETRACARDSVLALAANEETAVRLQKIGCKSVEVLSQVAVHPNRSDPVKPAAEATPLSLLSVGRLVYWKGFSIAARALGLAARAGVRFEWSIVGAGPELNRLRQIVEKSGIKESVRFVGQIPIEQVYSMMRQSELLIHPSLHESGGYVCAEAMSNGLPVMCFNYGGPRVLVSPDAGILINFESPRQCREDMAAHLVRIWRERSCLEHLSQKCLKHVQSRLTWNHLGEHLNRIYTIVSDGAN